MMQLSFIIPAFNEEVLLGDCITSIQDAVAFCQSTEGHSISGIEIIVVDNNSTDATAAVAQAHGAVLVFEAINQISRARNAGAAIASGDWLIFIDADSELSPGLLSEVLSLQATRRYIGFGSRIALQDIPDWAGRLLYFWTWVSERLNWAAGSFITCEAAAFRDVGGFSEALYAAEEVDFSRRIKRLAEQRGQQFVVLTDHPLQTSNRKLALYSGWEMFRQIMRLMLQPRKSLRDPATLDVWYDGRR